MKFIVLLFILVFSINSFSKTKKITYVYDKFNRLESFKLPSGVHADYKYDEYGRVIILNNNLDSTRRGTIAKFIYKYNRRNDVIERNRSDESDDKANDNYSYDSLDRLKSYNCSGDICPRNNNMDYINSINYEFDDIGNIKLEKTNNKTINYTYSLQDPTRLISISNGCGGVNIPYDNNGNMLVDFYNRSISYDPYERVNEINNRLYKYEYRYNGDGNLVYQSTPKVKSSYLIYSNDNVLSYIINNKKISYIYGDKGIGYNDEDSYNYYLSSRENTVVNKIKIPNNDYPELIDYSYSPYGNEVDNVPEYDQNLEHFSFNGLMSDNNVNLQFIGQRAYSPMLKRFINKDPLSPFGNGGINGYIYSKNNPLSNNDLNGNFSTPFNIAMGFSIGLSASLITSEIGGLGGFVIGALFGAIGSNIDTIDNAIHHKNINWKTFAYKTSISAALGGFLGTMTWEEYPLISYNYMNNEPKAIVNGFDDLISNSTSSLAGESSYQRPNLFIGAMIYNPLFDDDYESVTIIVKQFEEDQTRIRNVYFSNDFESSLGAENIEMQNVHTYGFGKSELNERRSVAKRFTDKIKSLYSGKSTKNDFDPQIEEFGLLDGDHEDEGFF